MPLVVLDVLALSSVDPSHAACLGDARPLRTCFDGLDASLFDFSAHIFSGRAIVTNMLLVAIKL